MESLRLRRGSRPVAPWPGNESTKCNNHTNQGHQQQVGLVTLGQAHQANWVKPKITVQATALPKIDRVTIGIAAPREFRRHFLEDEDRPKSCH